MSNEKRTKVWVDHFQTKLTLRITGYLVLFLFAGIFVVAAALWAVLNPRGPLFEENAP